MPQIFAEHYPVFAEHYPDPELTTPGVIDPKVTFPRWLAATLASQASLSVEERRAYRLGTAFIEFSTDPDNIGEAAVATVRAEWGPDDARNHIMFRSADMSLAKILREPPRKYRATFTVRLDWALLLDLTKPQREPETAADAEVLAGTPAPIDDQPITTQQPTGASDTLTVAERARAPKW
jgi:hypothetical protein